MKNLTSAFTKIAGRTGLVLRKHSPEILLVTGIVGGVGAAVLACRATLKVEGILDNHRSKVGKIAECWEKVKEGDISLDEYSEEDHQKDLAVVYTQTAVDFIKVYGPAVTLGIASVACIVGGHGILKRRNVALIAAYKAIEEGFNAYRKRVVAEHGEEVDYMYKNGLHAETVTETEVGEDGKATKVKKTKLVAENPDKYSIYARYFDETSPEWANASEYNLTFLKTQQNYYNNMLQARGHVFLNEVYDALGLPRSRAGSIVGWAMTDDGDNFIDFGIFDGDKMISRDFVNGHEKSILLDFNVDGVIYDLLK